MPKPQSGIRPAFLAGRGTRATRAAAAVPSPRSTRGVGPGPCAASSHPTRAGPTRGRLPHGAGTLARSQPDADLVVVFGSHRSEAGPSTVFLGEGWETPLGRLTSARELADEPRRTCDLEEEPRRSRPAR